MRACLCSLKEKQVKNIRQEPSTLPRLRPGPCVLVPGPACYPAQAALISKERSPPKGGVLSPRPLLPPHHRKGGKALSSHYLTIANLS